ncbi:unnamed protein product [Paramecium sonneborni]|uniref:Uncharacterized protein n=1 Tax=Paramecium sonneborni TaxID=65129 RepID=A0A8S1N3R4_9CILI|nr:unnamed protein product [Paramecium sonneborni]CAD8084751.1 unnamed protein product [Paramecium sonneborni]
MSDTLETIANTILAYIGITNEIASCDLTIFNQNYNNPSKREKTLHQLSIKNDLTIEARLRWIGGR